MKSNKLLFTTLLFLGIFQSLFGQQVIGYLPYYRGFNPNFDYGKYTHVHYFAIWPDADGGFIYPGAMDSVSMANQFQDIAEAARPQGTKMIMTFGGTAENGSKHFAALATDSLTRQKFIANIMALSKTWEFDGIDIDWEWGNPQEPASDQEAFAKLLSELRTECDKEGLSLSTDVSASSYYGGNYDAQAVMLCDYINVMSYSYNGGWAKTAKHHSPMNLVRDTGLSYWTNQGVPKNKLNLGVAFYAHEYMGATSSNDAFTSMKTLTYTQVKQKIDQGYTVVEDNENGSYCYSNDKKSIIFYDSPKNVAHKMAFAKQDGYSGVIIWEIGQDDNSQSLSTAIDDEKAGKVTSLSTTEETTMHLQQHDDHLTLQFDEDKPGIIRILSLQGQVIVQKPIDTSSIHINTFDIPAGLHLLEVSQAGSRQVIRIVLP